MGQGGLYLLDRKERIERWRDDLVNWMWTLYVVSMVV